MKLKIVNIYLIFVFLTHNGFFNVAPLLGIVHVGNFILKFSFIDEENE